MRIGRAAASAALLATVLAVAACGNPQEREAFASAKDAVSSTAGAPAHPDFQDLALRHLTGLKGSKADVVCGSVAVSGGTEPFVYIWRLKPAVPDPGRKTGEVMLVSGGVDRHAANTINHFCSDEAQTSAANPYDYFD